MPGYLPKSEAAKAPAPAPVPAKKEDDIDVEKLLKWVICEGCLLNIPFY